MKRTIIILFALSVGFVAHASPVLMPLLVVKIDNKTTTSLEGEPKPLPQGALAPLYMFDSSGRYCFEVQDEQAFKALKASILHQFERAIFAARGKLNDALGSFAAAEKARTSIALMEFENIRLFNEYVLQLEALCAGLSAYCHKIEQTCGFCKETSLKTAMSQDDLWGILKNWDAFLAREWAHVAPLFETFKKKKSAIASFYQDGSVEPRQRQIGDCFDLLA